MGAVATVQKKSTNDDVIRQYLPLVKRIAYHMMARLPASVEVDDLIQVGLIGLMDAVSRFDGSQGAQFESYVCHAENPRRHA